MDSTNIALTFIHDNPETALSAVLNVAVHDILHTEHPFSAGAETSCGALQELLHTSEQLSSSLNVYLSGPVSNTRLVSLLKQHSDLVNSLHNVKMIFTIFLFISSQWYSQGGKSTKPSKRCEKG
jgi:hypothetical protein